MSTSQISDDTLRAKLGSTPELLEVARRAVWFKKPNETLAEPILFLSHLMTYTLASDVVLIERLLDKSEIGYVLDHAPPGVFDGRSWSFWHVRAGRSRVAPLPVRRIPERL